MIALQCKYCNERVNLISGPTTNIQLNEFLGTGIWIYLHLKEKHPERIKRYNPATIQAIEEFTAEIKKTYKKIFYEFQP